MAKVALINLADVSPGAIEDVVEAAELPAGEIRLIIGDERLGEDYHGLCIPRRFAPSAANLYGLEEYLIPALTVETNRVYKPYTLETPRRPTSHPSKLM